MKIVRTCLAALAIAATACPATAGEASVAVAANFVTTLQRIVEIFEAGQPHSVATISGSTGKLAAQIVHGAPFDVFLAADQQRPQRLEADGYSVAGSRFTYALGSLALCSNSAESVSGGLAGAIVAADSIAIANPDLAPYGRAANQVLQRLGQRRDIKLITGQSVGQVYGFVVSGTVRLGFVARAQVIERPGDRLHCLDVPGDMYDPILQDAVLLSRASDNQAARAFMDFLRSSPARDLIAKAGYELAQ